MSHNNRDPRNPTEVTTQPWIHAYREHGTYPRNKNDCGKWLVFADYAILDQTWAVIRHSVTKGVLGNCAKTSTKYRNPNAVSHTQGVICVYTYSLSDINDVMRIRSELTKLGITHEIPYKTDSATAAGHYANRGTAQIALRSAAP